MHEACDTGMQSAGVALRTGSSAQGARQGYQFVKGRYVVSNEDPDSVRPRSTRIIDIVQFADASTIDSGYVDGTSPYRDEAFAVRLAAVRNRSTRDLCYPKFLRTPCAARAGSGASRAGEFLHSTPRASTGRRSAVIEAAQTRIVRIVADRVGITRDGRTIDLATGAPVV